MAGLISDAVPPNPADLMRRIKNLEQLVQRLVAGRSLENATINNAPGKGIRSSDFDGTSFSDPGTQGVYFGGDGAVLNHVFFQPGAITNDWLAAPVYPAVAHAESSGFSLAPGANVAKATATVTVPNGYTRALVTATAEMSVRNSTASLDTFYVSALIQSDSTIGWSAQDDVPAGTGGSACHTATALLTGLTSGATFAVKASGSTYAGTWAASGSNTANIDATIIFLR